MAKKSDIAKTDRLHRKQANAKAAGVKMKKETRVHNRCGLCGRRHGYMRRFHLCRICFRERALRGEITGVRKSSW